ncbi:MAG: G5 domain-containing protein [Candidatus Berkelbacteria bacterium]
MHRLTRQAKIFVTVLFAIIGIGVYLAWPKTVEKQVAGAHTQNDPNHPTEVYFGSADFKTLETMLQDLSVKVYPEDKTTTFPPPEMGLGSRITIVRATPVQVTDAKMVKTYRTWKDNIGDFLTEQNIGLLGKDSVDPSAQTKITSNMKIKITRVAEVEVTQKEDIDFKTVKKETRDMERGQTKVEQKGEKGQKEVVYIVKRIDGEEVSRRVKETNILKDPVTEFLIVGTGPKMVHNGIYMDLLNAAAKKYDVNATALQCLMMRESNGHVDSVASAGYIGLFQYDPGFWGPASEAAGFAGALWTDAKAQIFTTARLISIGQSRRWPPFAHCANL